MIGRFDNLYGDEDECRGHCGLCDACIEKQAYRDELAFEWFREEELFQNFMTDK